MNRRQIIIAVATFGVARPVFSQTSKFDPCAPLGRAAYRDAARDSWPIVVRNAFDEVGRGSVGLTVAISKDATQSQALGACRDPIVLNNLLLNPDGRTSGNVMTVAGSTSALGQRIYFDVNRLDDWTFQPPVDTKAYGAFRLRAGGDSPRLHASPLPSNWE